MYLAFSVISGVLRLCGLLMVETIDYICLLFFISKLH